MLDAQFTRPLQIGARTVRCVPIADYPGRQRLPFSLRILLENLARQRAMGKQEAERQIDALLQRRVGAAINFMPSRIFGQDILGKVMLVDLAALRDALAAAGVDPQRAAPRIPVDIIIDHSLQVDVFGRPDAAQHNLEQEYRRNRERFAFLRWCAASFDKVRVVPPGKGIMHQIHIEHLAELVRCEPLPLGELATPDSCVGTDSHTPMVNALGVLGWGVGGIEAEAAMLGLPIAMTVPETVGVRLEGRLGDGALPTDAVLHITEMLRKARVVGSFVEFCGPGLETLALADRATIANMAPEYGATVAYFPIDRTTIDYLRLTGRTEAQCALVEAYARAQGLWREGNSAEPVFERVLAFDLGTVRSCIAGPRNPEQRIELAAAAAAFAAQFSDRAGRLTSHEGARDAAAAGPPLEDGAVVIAAITSCTNTSNPTSMLAAGLLARNARRRGLGSKPWVKTSLAPGSHVAAEILARAGLQPALDELGFHVVGYGCTTCNGGSGPLAPEIAAAIAARGLVATAVLSGNRNFAGRIHPDVQAAYLASPALVVAYAIAGSMRIDLSREALGLDIEGHPVFLREIWPSAAEIEAALAGTVDAATFREKYAELFEGDASWQALALPGSARFPWHADSSYIRPPPYFDRLAPVPGTPRSILGARALAILGDSVTTDDISPSGAISLATPAADYLQGIGVGRADFNNYTTRRGNHEVAVRATFANVRLRNRMVPEREGGFTRLQPEGRIERIFEAANLYRQRGVAPLIIAGENYGCGSSRDWAAKGVALLGVPAVIAGSFERIHRSNLVGMGVLPLELPPGSSAEALQLDGSELFDIDLESEPVSVGSRVELTIRDRNGRERRIGLKVRLDTPEDVAYWRHGGILPAVWRQIVGAQGDRGQQP